MSLFQKLDKVSHRILLQMLLIFLALILIYGTMTALYMYFNSDVLYKDTAFTVVIYEVLEYFGYFMFWFAFSFLLLLQSRYERPHTVVLWFVPVSILFYGMAFLIQVLFFGQPEGMDYITYGVNICGNMVQVLLGWFIVYYMAQKGDKENVTIWFLSLIPFIIRVGSRIYYDIQYGAPTKTNEIILMIIYYLADVFFVVLGYYLIRLIVLVARNRLVKEQEE